MKQIFLIACILLSSIAYSQTELTGYSNYAVGIKQNFTKKLGLELKVFTNKGNIERSSVDFGVLYDFTFHDFQKFSIGFGVNFFPLEEDCLNSFYIPMVLELHPIKNMKRFSFIIQLSPEFDAAEFLNLRQMWGIRYSFGKKYVE